jgi:hypothetical protein
LSVTRTRIDNELSASKSSTAAVFNVAPSMVNELLSRAPAPGTSVN